MMYSKKVMDHFTNPRNVAVAEALDGLPAIKMHCSALAEEVIHLAINDYRSNAGLEAWDYKKHDNN